MKDAARFLFLTRHGVLRSGWKILFFLIGWAGLSYGLATAHALPGNDLAANAVMMLVLLLVTWLMVRFVNKKPFGAVGLWFHPRAVRELGMGLLIGFLMMSGIFVVLLATGYVRVEWLGRPYGQIFLTLIYALTFFGFAAAVEELLFRGYMFQTLLQGITLLPAILVMSAIFGIAHFYNPNATAFSTANVMLAGIWLSFAYQKTRSLWLPFGLHLAWNFTQTTVYGFPTSGNTFADHRLWNATVQGPDWLTGGAFGPEGGVLTTLALILGTWYILKSRYLGTPEGIITLDSVEDLLPPLAPSVQAEGGSAPSDGVKA